MVTRKSIKALLTAVLCTGAMVTAAGTADAATSARDGGTVVLAVNTFQNLDTLRCMDDSNLGFRTFPCNSLDFQKWNVHVFNDGTRRFQNLATGRCLYDGPAGFSTQFCGSSENVSWHILRHHEVRLTFRNQATDRCIDDSDNSGFRTTRCNGGLHQDWV
ncbi:hypothetical protein QQY66_40875 [Streptomyces sp. DG2A-72]|uniref:RICIN domain-containing protein n=1 Tax=Streptomyces sp. DG2A-72 TaxID=3051386 RepID=UPI00265C7344|nr:RICIN domain-containing protein [Streptomyces sp. DG2A-72]MDO0937776.1 hypothetical protein [Streptomyces sp. DG2A-72]